MTSRGTLPEALFVAVVLALVTTHGARAQPVAEGEDEAEILFIRSWTCDPASVQEAFEILDGIPRSVAEVLIDEGRLTGWGVARQSGRQWNLYVDFQAMDRRTAVQAQRVWSSRLADADPDRALRDRFAAICPDHRDSLFSIGDCPPPTGESP